MQNVLRTNRAPNPFYRWFAEAAVNNVAAARLLQELCWEFRQPAALIAQIHDLEHREDVISQQIDEQLNKVFLPPLDREDMLALTSALDEVVDAIHAAAEALWVYHVRAPPQVTQELAAIILACTEEAAGARPRLPPLHGHWQLEAAVIELYRLENQAAHLLRQGLIDLYRVSHDRQTILAWDTIYETMEAVTDRSGARISQMCSAAC